MREIGKLLEFLSQRVQDGFIAPDGEFIPVTQRYGGGGHHKNAPRLLKEWYPGWDFREEPELIEKNFTDTGTWGLIYKGWVRVGYDPGSARYMVWTWNSQVRRLIESHLTTYVLPAEPDHDRLEVMVDELSSNRQSWAKVDEFFELGPDFARTAATDLTSTKVRA